MDAIELLTTTKGVRKRIDFDRPVPYALLEECVEIAVKDVDAKAAAKLSPTGKVPVLETPQGTIFESNAIARYVARLRSDADLYGRTFYESAVHRSAQIKFRGAL